MSSAISSITSNEEALEELPLSVAPSHDAEMPGQDKFLPALPRPQAAPFAVQKWASRRSVGNLRQGDSWIVKVSRPAL